MLQVQTRQPMMTMLFWCIIKIQLFSCQSYIYWNRSIVFFEFVFCKYQLISQVKLKR